MSVVGRPNTRLHKCAKEDCNALCSKEYCRHHVVRYNNCSYEGGWRRGRKEFCGYHKPEFMEKHRIAMRRLRETRRGV